MNRRVIGKQKTDRGLHGAHGWIFRHHNVYGVLIIAAAELVFPPRMSNADSFHSRKRLDCFFQFFDGLRFEDLNIVIAFMMSYYRRIR